jgi:hypothetical protein
MFMRPVQDVDKNEFLFVTFEALERDGQQNKIVEIVEISAYYFSRL